MTDGKATDTGRRRPMLAVCYGAPIGLLGGLIGLGGAEFRLPVLAGPLAYSARQAVPLNLAVTLVTIVASLGSRGASLSFDSVAAYVHVILALMVGSVLGASLGPSLSNRLSEHQFERLILVLLLGLGGGLIFDSIWPHESSGAIYNAMPVQVGAGLLFGLTIGLISSLLGVAGGELLIPTLVLAFGLDIKTAGTASLFVSVPMVIVGVGSCETRSLHGSAGLERHGVAHEREFNHRSNRGRIPRSRGAISSAQGDSRGYLDYLRCTGLLEGSPT